MKELGNGFSINYYLVFKKEKILLFVLIGVNLKGIVLSIISKGLRDI